ncbi:MAG: hypothetical protein HZA31_14160 [Opitutae bacterium]|nr:hypothetical protein [Opitutae bacterium]
MSVEFTLPATVAYWDVDRDDTLQLPALFKFLQEAAVKHADLFAAGTRAIATRGESWVLNRLAVVCHRYPKYEEPLRVVTWSSGIHLFKGYRDFRVFCGDELVVSASSLWLYINLQTKSLVRVPADLAAAFPSRPGEAFRPDLDKLRLAPPAATAVAPHLISVRYSDIDSNGHVNNTAYFDYLQTALVRSGLSPRPRSLEIQFLKEIPPEADAVAVQLESRADEIAFGLGQTDGWFAQGRLRV